MFESALQIQFLSDWHIGSGLGDGAIADAALNRDAYGIPCIPGTAIKGALREGAWRLGLCSPELGKLTDLFFGTASDTRVSNQPGLVCVAQGVLEAGLRQWLATEPDGKEFIGDMTIIRQQTRLDHRKMVVPHTLRSIECGIPGIEFTSSISANIPPDAHAWFSCYLGAICACVKSLGGYRSRGIGRCHITPACTDKHNLPGEITASLLALRRGYENS